LDNIENYIPFKISNQTNEKDKQIDTEQLENMQRLLNSKTAILSDDIVKNFKDLWSKSIDKDQRQALYRYWLFKYVQLITGLIDHYLEVFVYSYFFSLEEYFRLNEQYDENHQSMQDLWLANDRLYMDKTFM